MSVLALNETWLRKDTINKIKLPGYNLEHKIRKGRRGGVTIAINDALKYRHRDDLDSELATIKHLWIELKTNAESILVCCAYRPPNVSSKHFIDDYNQLITCGEKSNKEMIIAMDSNLDLLKSSSHSHTQLFLENNIIKNIYPCISKPTHVTHSTATLIDNIWCSGKTT